MGFGPIGSLPIVEISFGGFDIGGGKFAKFVKSQRMSRIIIEVAARNTGANFVNTIEPMPIASGPILYFPAYASGGLQRTFTFSDGPWYGRPQDTLRPNKAASPRISQSADIERIIPLSPETGRRGSVTIGSFELVNTDGGLDDILENYSIGDQIIRIWYGPANGDFAEFKLIGEMFGEQMEATYDVVRLLVKSTSAYLDKPLWRRKYTGKGGVGGDVSLAGTIIPQCFGEVPNLTPVLVLADQGIYQVADGPILAVDAVKERGLPFDAVGDYVDFEALIAAPVAAGEYATCLSLGLFKAVFSIPGEPAGPVTCDVRGEVTASGYVDQIGDTLLNVATQRAAIPVSYLDVQSFNGLPTGTIGYFTGQSALKVSDLFDAFMSSINGWYGSDRNKLLRVGFIEEPQNKVTINEISEADILNIEQISLPQQPRYEQTVTYAKNWTVMSESDVALILPADERGKLIAASTPITQISRETLLRERSAIIGTNIDTYFKAEVDARGTLSRVMNLYKEKRRQFRVTMRRSGYLLNLGEYVLLRTNYLGLQAGLKVVVLAIKDSGQNDQVEVTVWG